MFDERVGPADFLDIVDALGAGLQPGGAVQTSGSEAAAPLNRRPEAAVPDMPAAVGGLVIAAYAGLVGVLALTMARDAGAAFVIAISAFYVAMFLSVPAVFLRVEGDASRRPTLAQFMEQGIDTLTGRTSGAGALVQILLVPVLVTLGLLVIGLIALATL